MIDLGLVGVDHAAGAAVHGEHICSYLRSIKDMYSICKTIFQLLVRKKIDKF
jgi:hypothetical protein